MTQPTQRAVQEARRKAGLTQAQAAALIHCSVKAWIKWESGERKMHPAMWELFQLKTTSPSLSQ